MKHLINYIVMFVLSVGIQINALAQENNKSESQTLQQTEDSIKQAKKALHSELIAKYGKEMDALVESLQVRLKHSKGVLSDQMQTELRSLYQNLNQEQRYVFKVKLAENIGIGKKAKSEIAVASTFAAGFIAAFVLEVFCDVDLDKYINSEFLGAFLSVSLAATPIIFIKSYFTANSYYYNVSTALENIIRLLKLDSEVDLDIMVKEKISKKVGEK